MQGQDMKARTRDHWDTCVQAYRESMLPLSTNNTTGGLENMQARCNLGLETCKHAVILALKHASTLLDVVLLPEGSRYYL